MSLGICLPWQLAERDASYYTRTRHALGWPVWMNWKYDCIGMDGYTPMLWAAKHGPHMTRAIEMAQRFRGHLWLMGNEPEIESQSHTEPAEVADVLRTWLALVGGTWAGPGVLWGDEGRAWIDAYLRLDGPLPDAWAIHIYGSDTVQGWLDQYIHAQRWLTARAQRPIWVTETNAYSDIAGQEPLLRFLAMQPDITAYWYCSHDSFGPWRNSDLHDEQGQLTALGQTYAYLNGAHAARHEHNVHLPFLPG